MATKTKKKVYSVVLPIELMRRIMHLAIEGDKSRSAVIVEILAEYLKKNQQG